MGGSMMLSFGEAFSKEAPASHEGELGIPRITLRHLVYFAAAARNESALRAAEELNVSPPAISGAIACLEQILGQKLFIRRHARGLLLTDSGHHLLLEARDVIGRVHEIEAIRTNKSRQIRSLSFGCLGDIAPNLIPPLVRSFQAHYPQVDIRWQTACHAELKQRLEDGVLDVIIVLDFELSPAFQSNLLQNTPAQCVLPSEHRLANGPVSLKALEKEPFIMLDIPSTRDYFLSVFGDLGLQPNVAHRAPSADMVRSLVANGFGYSLLNFCTPDRRNIVYQPIDGDIRPSHLVAVRQYRRRASKISDDFVEHARTVALESNLCGTIQ